MRKYSVVLFLCVFLLLFSVSAVGESIYSMELKNNSVKINTSNLDVKSKIIVEKGNQKYYYNLNNLEEAVPLQLGKGKYVVKIVEHISGNKYRVIKKNEFNIKDDLIKELYTASNQPVYWESQERTVELGNDLTKNIKDDKKKVEAIYNYIIKNIEYDPNKMKTLDDSYVPGLDKILSSGKGICYDYASLFAGILRSQGIPTKLIKGYKSDLKAYHAWNEVFINNEWVAIDTTYDAAFKASKTKVSMIKEKNEYNNLKVY